MFCEEGGPQVGGRHARRFWRKMGQEAPFWLEAVNEFRMRRGDVKYALLEALLKRPMHGYDIMQELEGRHEGRYRPSPGSVYPTLQMLEDGGFVTSQVVDGKRVYTITDAGRTMLDERKGVAGQDRAGDGDWGEVRDSARKLVDAMRQAFSADAQTRNKIRQVIDKTRREIYTILGGGE